MPPPWVADPLLQIRPRRACGLPRLLALGVWLACPLTRPAAAQDDRQTTSGAVLPPRTAIIGLAPAAGADERDRWIPIAFEELLTWRMQRVAGSGVVPTIRVVQARRELAPPPAGVGGSSAQASAGPLEPAASVPWATVLKGMGVSRQVVGECSGPPPQTRVHLRLERLVEPSVPAREATFGPAAFDETLNQATLWLLGELGIGSIDAPTEKLVLSPPSSSVSAVEFMAKAAAAARLDDLRNALYYLRQSVDYDPAFRLAQMRLAQMELRLPDESIASATSRVRQLVLVAGELNDLPDLIEGELLLAHVNTINRQFDVAEARLGRALELAERARAPYAVLAVLVASAEMTMVQAGFLEAGSKAGTAEAGAEPAPGADAPSDPSDGGSAGAAAGASARRAVIERAVELQRRVLAQIDLLGDGIARAQAASRLGAMLSQMGDAAGALAAHQASLAAAEQSGSAAGQATALLFLSRAYREAGRPAEAVAALERCLPLAPREAHITVQLSLAQALADDAVARYADAARQYEQAYLVIQQSADLAAQLECARRIAELYWKVKDRTRALKFLRDAIDVAHAMELPQESELRQLLDAWQKSP